MNVFLDTNVLVYLFDADTPKKRAAAARLLARESCNEQVVLSTQVLQEFYVAVTRKLANPLAADAALRALESFAELSLVAVDAEMVISAAKRSAGMRISFWDALIVEAALNGDCGVLYTEDLQEGLRIDGMVVENPFHQAA